MHKSILLDESIKALNIKENGIYVDCTLGYAGHSEAILKGIKKGKLYAFDQDNIAREFSQKKLSKISNNFEIIPTNFSNLKSELNKRGVEKVDGILFDLGVSSPQIDDSSRGFSFHEDAKLDMRMDQSALTSAYDVVNNYSYNELAKILFTYGEEKYSKYIARNIEKQRLIKPIETTLELVDVIYKSVPEKYKRLGHPARKTFQAIRIEVNKELEVFSKALLEAIDLLNKDGIIAVISFHSLEDKICKKTFREYSEVDKVVKGLPEVPDMYKPILELNKRIKPSKEEVLINKRSRSAILRSARKL